MFNDKVRTIAKLLLTGSLAGSILISPGLADSTPTPRYQPSRFSKRAGLHYELVWGVDSLNVKWAESGEPIRFSWRVVDATKASVINEKKAEPQLIDPQAGVSLVIPAL